MKTILVVEPEEPLRSFYELELKEEGYRVIIARSSHVAVKLLRIKCPDLLIIDLWGWPEQTVARMEDVIHGTHIPVIINTGYPLSCVNVLLSERVTYVLKSSNLFRLKEQIRRLMTDKHVSAIDKRMPAALLRIL